MFSKFRERFEKNFFELIVLGTRWVPGSVRPHVSWSTAYSQSSLARRGRLDSRDCSVNSLEFFSLKPTIAPFERSMLSICLQCAWNVLRIYKLLLRPAIWQNAFFPALISIINWESQFEIIVPPSFFLLNFALFSSGQIANCFFAFLWLPHSKGTPRTIWTHAIWTWAPFRPAREPISFCFWLGLFGCSSDFSDSPPDSLVRVEGFDSSPFFSVVCECDLNFIHCNKIKLSFSKKNHFIVVWFKRLIVWVGRQWKRAGLLKRRCWLQSTGLYHNV